MTMIRVAPQPVLSADGRACVVVSDGRATLIRTRDAAIERLRTEDEVTIAALDPTGSRCAVAGDDFVALWQCAWPSRLLATARIDGPLLRLAVAEDLIAGVVASDEENTALGAWQGVDLSASGPVVSLGPSAPDELLLDGTRRRVLVSGLKGPRASTGEGEFFVRLFELNGGDWRPIWQGEAAPRRPNGFIFPLAGGALGVYDRRSLAILRAPATSAAKWEPAANYPWGNLETVRASPLGTFAAWFWSDDDDDERYRARVAELSRGTITADLPIERIGDSPALAVDDQGSPTLAFGVRPDRVVIARPEAGSLRPGTPIDIPRARAAAG